MKTKPMKAPVVAQLPLDEVVVSPYQPRREWHDGDLDELTASIREHGVLNPVLVRALLTGHELIAGERRWRAAKLAGQTTIPAIVRHGVSDREAAELAIIENVQRKNISLLDEAFAYKRLRDEFNLSADDIATRCNRSTNAIYTALRVADLPSAVSAMVQEGKLTYSHAAALTALAPYGETEIMAHAEDAARLHHTAERVTQGVQEFRTQKEREAAEREAREKPPLPLDAPEADAPDAPKAEEAGQSKGLESNTFKTPDEDEETESGNTDAAEIRQSGNAAPSPLPDTPMDKPEPRAPEPPAAPPVKSAREIASAKAAAPTAPTLASAPALPKAPEGFLSTFVPRDDCFFCQNAGLTMQDIFGTVRRLIEMGKPFGLDVNDLLTTLEGMLTGDGDSEEPDSEKSDAETVPGAETTLDSEAIQAVRACRVCGCTDENCAVCIEKTGVSCHWVKADLCSACAPQEAEEEAEPTPEIAAV